MKTDIFCFLNMKGLSTETRYVWKSKDRKERASSYSSFISHLQDKHVYLCKTRRDNKTKDSCSNSCYRI